MQERDDRFHKIMNFKLNVHPNFDREIDFSKGPTYVMPKKDLNDDYNYQPMREPVEETPFDKVKKALK